MYILHINASSLSFTFCSPFLSLSLSLCFTGSGIQVKSSTCSYFLSFCLFLFFFLPLLQVDCHLVDPFHLYPLISSNPAAFCLYFLSLLFFAVHSFHLVLQSRNWKWKPKRIWVKARGKAIYPFFSCSFSPFVSVLFCLPRIATCTWNFFYLHCNEYSFFQTSTVGSLISLQKVVQTEFKIHVVHVTCSFTIAGWACDFGLTCEFISN